MTETESRFGQPLDAKFKCNRCKAELMPTEATRDRDKPGYVHRDDCPPKSKRRV